MEKERQKNKTVRAAYRGHCTRDVKKAKDIMASEDPNLKELEETQERLTRRIKEISEMDNAIRMSLEDPTLLTEEVENALEFGDVILNIQLEIRNFLERKRGIEVQHPVSQFQLDNSIVKEIPAPRAHVKLPEISIKAFSGDPLEWLTFWDSFSAAVDRDTEMSGIQKMNYLKGYLKGEAARAVSGLPLTDENYHKAVELLKDRFGRNQILINAYMESLIKINAPSSDVKRLRTFYDTCESYIRGLESLGVVTDTYGSLLIPVLLKKLPEEVRRLILRANSHADSSLNELRNGLREEIETREKSHMSVFIGQDTAPSTSGETCPPTAGALVAGAAPQENQAHQKANSRKCVYCDGKHKPENCEKISTVEARKAVLIQRRKCFNCFGGNHMSKNCYSSKRCHKCHRKHHASICKADDFETPTQDTKNKKQPKKEEKPQEESDNTSSTHQGITHARNHQVIQMQSALVTAKAEDKSARARILFDTGSQRTFVTKKLSDKLRLKPIKKEILEVTTFGSKQSERNEYKVVSFKLLGKEACIDVTALESPTICPPIAAKATYTLEDYPEISELDFADGYQESPTQHLDIDILVGNDYYGHLMIGEMIKCQKNGVIAMNSKFGWILSGPLSHNSDSDVGTVCHRIDTDNSNDKDLEKLLPRFWELNTIGIKDDHPDEEDRVHIAFQQDINFNENTGRYTVRLPWKDNNKHLPSNYGLCKRRLYSLHQSLQKRSIDTLEQYHQRIQDQLKSGFIEKVHDMIVYEGKLHYIAHFPVFKDSITTRMRIVYDGSAKTKGPNAASLNDCLHTGPNLLNDLTAILLRFRVHSIAIVADIEKAFLQIELDKRDRDATRFLWIKDVTKPIRDDNLEVYRFCRVLFGAAPSPFLLQATVQYHLDKSASNSDWVAKDLKEIMYMDNVVTGVADDKQAVHYYTHSRELLATAGMNLRQWTTNSTVLKQKVKENNSGASDIVKVLGLVWNSEKDILSLNISKLIEDVKKLEKITKRTVLSVAASIFDPLGFVEPFTVKAKILMQELWKRNLIWDEELPSDLRLQWTSWMEDIKCLSEVSIPRQYFASNGSNLQLHVFCDSSPKAYGAVAYLRSEYGASKPKIAMVVSKSRVAPVKQKTIPVLELLAALVGARLSEYIVKKLTADSIETWMWSDSQIVLSWLTAEGTLKRSVANKIQAIKQATPKSKWEYCPTENNPADLLTRGIPAKLLGTNSLWFNGPPWLKEDSCTWPVWTHQKTEPKESDGYKDGLVCNIKVKQTDPSILNIIDLERFSDLNKLIRVTALVTKFTEVCKGIQLKRGSVITTQEYNNANQMLIKAQQAISYASELEYLKQTSKSKYPSIIYQLGLFLDKDGVIRCRGRIEHSNLSFDTKHPILLPKESYLTKLIVMAMHARVMHNGVGETLTEIRQRFWIPQGRQLIKHLIRKCVTCKKVEGKPFPSVKTPPLPKSRVTGNHAFQVTGVDYAGPIYVRETNAQPSKMYICLFTCANIRAVHLELVEDLSAEAFIRAFKRFINRRGVPELIVSDNAKNFKAASVEIIRAKNEILEVEKTQHFLASHGIKWWFIAERAPWWGGFYERLIGTMKRCLKKVLGKASLKIFEVTTMLTEVEATLNSRPLTYPSSDVNDLTPLTPSHFLCGFRIMNLPEVRQRTEEDNEEFMIKVADEKRLTKRVQYHERLMKSFWLRWQREYLTSLRQAHKGKKEKEGPTLNVSDVVLVHDELPRNRWKLGVIEKIFPGIDGLVRAVNVRVASGKTMRRAIEKLYPLEIRTEESSTANDGNIQERPRRAAAQKAQTQIRKIMTDEQ